MELGAGYTPVEVEVDDKKATVFTWPREKLTNGKFEKLEDGNWN